MMTTKYWPKELWKPAVRFAHNIASNWCYIALVVLYDRELHLNVRVEIFAYDVCE